MSKAVKTPCEDWRFWCSLALTPLVFVKGLSWLFWIGMAILHLSDLRNYPATRSAVQAPSFAKWVFGVALLLLTALVVSGGWVIAARNPGMQDPVNFAITGFLVVIAFALIFARVLADGNSASRDRRS